MSALTPQSACEKLRFFLQKKGMNLDKSSLAAMMYDAQTDVLLRTTVTDEAMHECETRARIIAFLTVRECVRLSEDEMHLADRLVSALSHPLNVVRRLTKANLLLSREALCAETEPPPCREIEKQWILELSTQYGTFSDEEHLQAKTLTDDFFKDGQPFTLKRFFAAEEALAQMSDIRPNDLTN